MLYREFSREETIMVGGMVRATRDRCKCSFEVKNYSYKFAEYINGHK